MTFASQHCPLPTADHRLCLHPAPQGICAACGYDFDVLNPSHELLMERVGTAFRIWQQNATARQTVNDAKAESDRLLKISERVWQEKAEAKKQLLEERKQRERQAEADEQRLAKQRADAQALIQAAKEKAEREKAEEAERAERYAAAKAKARADLKRERQAEADEQRLAKQRADAQALIQAAKEKAEREKAEEAERAERFVAAKAKARADLERELDINSKTEKLARMRTDAERALREKNVVQQRLNAEREKAELVAIESEMKSLMLGERWISSVFFVAGVVGLVYLYAWVLSLPMIAFAAWVGLRSWVSPATRLAKEKLKQDKKAAKQSAKNGTEVLLSALAKDKVVVEMVPILTGIKFNMGSPEHERGRNDDEAQRVVTVKGIYLIGKYPVTQAQWFAVMESNPSHFATNDENCAVENVSWNDVQIFIQRLNEKTGRRYRLTTEAEWEYAARAWSDTPFHTGQNLTADQANFDGSYSYLGLEKGVNRECTLPVGCFSQPNKFGLHDMNGNVWEWVQDCYVPNYVGVPIDGRSAPETFGSERVMRGGSWFNGPNKARSASRNKASVDFRSNTIGFRLAMSVLSTP